MKKKKLLRNETENLSLNRGNRTATRNENKRGAKCRKKSLQARMPEKMKMKTRINQTRTQHTKQNIRENK